MNEVPSPRGRRRPATFKPRLEALEDRTLPAPVTFAVLPGNVLRIRANSGNHRIAIFDNGTNTPNNIVVVADRAVFMPGLAFTGVLVRTGTGNNHVNYDLSGSLGAGTTRTVIVNLGTGANQFAAHLVGSLAARANLSLFVSGTGNFNNFNVLANVNIAANAALTMQEIGGPGPDLLGVRYSGVDAGALTVFASGMAGADTINQAFTLQPGSSGSLSAQESGGAGNDNLQLSDQRVSLFDNTTIATAIDGGLGFNKAVATSDVKVSHAAVTRI